MSNPKHPRAVTIPAGALFTVSTGAYSDYIVLGVFRAVVAIDTASELAEWLKTHPDQREDYHFDDGAFFADVARRGLVEAVPSYEWSLGAYRCSSGMELTKTDLTEPES